MFERYHIPIRPAPARAPPVPKFVIQRAENCINCGKCEQACIYGVHKRSEHDPRKMADPLNHLCKNCFRCLQECPQRALSMALGQEYRSLGRGLWTPGRITTVWGEAETGKIPVFGAGYRGMFVGPGYDAMWTDMSEIVRPTRDGIHGREYISTSVDVGRKPYMLEFDSEGGLRTEMPPIIELPVPMVLDVTRLRSSTGQMLLGFASAAKRLGTLMFVSPEALSQEAVEHLGEFMVPVYPEGTDVSSLELPAGVRMVELQHTPSWRSDLEAFRARYPGVVLSMRLSAGRRSESSVLDLARAGVDVAHLLYDEEGAELEGPEPRHAKESLKAIHRALVSEALRDQITIIAGGGMAAAEHVPKSIICGADLVALEKVLVIALECRDCVTCSLASCPASISSATAEWVECRITNMVGAWRDQLLEVLGAMGLREVRRLRGELGRAIFYEEVDAEAFSDIEGGAMDG